VVVTNTFAKANEGEAESSPDSPPSRAPAATWSWSATPRKPRSPLPFWKLGSVSSDEFRLMVQLPPHVERLIVFNEYKDLTAAGFFAPSDKVIMLDRWTTCCGSWARDAAMAPRWPSIRAGDQYCDEGGSG